MEAPGAQRFRLVLLAVGLAFAGAGCGPQDPDAPVSLAGTAHPSPSGCTVLTHSLRALYAELQHCDSDLDCVYVDGFYAIVPRSARNQEVTDFDCQEPSPFLVAANGASLQARLGELQGLRSAQAAVCGPPPQPSCTNAGGFTSTVPPACVSHACVPRYADDGSP